MKYLKLVIFLVIILIISLIVCIINISNNSNNVQNNLNVENEIIHTNNSNSISNKNDYKNNNVIVDETENYSNQIIFDGGEIDGKVNKLKDVNLFFTIEQCIQSYINNITNKNSEAIYNQLDNNYINNNGINLSNIYNFVENLNGNQEFRAIKMNYVQGNLYDQYSIFGKLLSNTGNTTDIYLILNINTGNLRFSIIPQVGKNYTDLSQVTIGVTNGDIIENSYNQGSYVRVIDENYIKSIMNDYQKNALYDTQNAYKTLDEEYSEARFTDYADYFKYVQNNVAKIEDLNLVSYSKEEKLGYTQYICRDIYDNVYTVKLTGIMEYTVILDDYTLQNESNYTSLLNESKVKYNVNKVIKMLNTCDYTHFYELLNENFKTNYFKTQEDFEIYIKTNFFEYNIVTSVDITEREDGIYICSVQMKDRSAVAANTMTKTIIIKLGTETDFEMSFDV